jgi:hypothetical protein
MEICGVSEGHKCLGYELYELDLDNLWLRFTMRLNVHKSYELHRCSFEF